MLRSSRKPRGIKKWGPSLLRFIGNKGKRFFFVSSIRWQLEVEIKNASSSVPKIGLWDGHKRFENKKKGGPEITLWTL